MPDGAGPTMIASSGIAISYEPRHSRLLTAAAVREPSIDLAIEGAAAGRSFDAGERYRFGSGWISWSVIPRLSLSGTLKADDVALDLGRATGYHDRNWGQWMWGDDARWDWAVFAAEGGDPMVVFTRDTTRDGAVVAGPIVLVDTAAGRRIFQDASVSVSLSGELEPPRLRLPGAMAALHQDRRDPRLPARMSLRCEDGFDVLEIEFRGESACQLITAEAAGSGYGFIHEIAGTFSMSARLRGERVDATGLAVFEYVW
jgi:hypothetical protein